MASSFPIETTPEVAHAPSRARRRGRAHARAVRRRVVVALRGLGPAAVLARRRPLRGGPAPGHRCRLRRRSKRRRARIGDRDLRRIASGHGARRDDPDGRRVRGDARAAPRDGGLTRRRRGRGGGRRRRRRERGSGDARAARPSRRARRERPARLRRPAQPPAAPPRVRSARVGGTAACSGAATGSEAVGAGRVGGTCNCAGTGARSARAGHRRAGRGRDAPAGGGRSRGPDAGGARAGRRARRPCGRRAGVDDRRRGPSGRSRGDGIGVRTSRRDGRGIGRRRVVAPDCRLVAWRGRAAAHDAHSRPRAGYVIRGKRERSDGLGG